MDWQGGGQDAGELAENWNAGIAVKKYKLVHNAQCWSNTR